MKFSVMVAIVAEEMEEAAIDAAREAGACGVSIVNARGQGTQEKKTFFGLVHEGAQSMLVWVLERRLSLKVLKHVTKTLDLENESRGIVFTLPIEHAGGIDVADIDLFEQYLKDTI